MLDYIRPSLIIYKYPSYEFKSLQIGDKKDMKIQKNTREI